MRLIPHEERLNLILHHIRALPLCDTAECKAIVDVLLGRQQPEIDHGTPMILADCALGLAYQMEEEERADDAAQCDVTSREHARHAALEYPSTIGPDDTGRGVPSFLRGL